MPVGYTNTTCLCIRKNRNAIGNCSASTWAALHHSLYSTKKVVSGQRYKTTAQTGKPGKTTRPWGIPAPLQYHEEGILHVF